MKYENLLKLHDEDIIQDRLFDWWDNLSDEERFKTYEKITPVKERDLF